MPVFYVPSLICRTPTPALRFRAVPVVVAVGPDHYRGSHGPSGPLCGLVQVSYSVVLGPFTGVGPGLLNA